MKPCVSCLARKIPPTPHPARKMAPLRSPCRERACPLAGRKDADKAAEVCPQRWRQTQFATHQAKSQTATQDWDQKRSPEARGALAIIPSHDAAQFGWRANTKLRIRSRKPARSLQRPKETSGATRAAALLSRLGARRFLQDFQKARARS